MDVLTKYKRNNTNFPVVSVKGEECMYLLNIDSVLCLSHHASL